MIILLNRFEKAINLKNTQNENKNENLSGKSMLLKEKLKNIDNNKTQIIINLKNENKKTWYFSYRNK